MKKRILICITVFCCLILSLCVLVACNNNSGEQGNIPSDTEQPEDKDTVYTEGLVFLLNEDGTSYYVSAYTGNSTEVIISKGYEGLPVTSIGDYAFEDCSGLTTVTIPDSVTSIGSGAFAGCTGLTSVTIPDGVTSIGYGAFLGCNGLNSITVEEGNAVYHSEGNCLIETESKTLIAGCKTSVIPSDGSVTSIGDYAFAYCTGLTSVTIPDSVTSIGDYAFEDCTGLTSVTIGNSVTSIGDYAFYYCTGLTSVTIGSGVTSIGDYAFRNCTGLTEIVWNATSVEDFSYNSDVFYNAGTAGDGITVTFGGDVQKIPACLFYVGDSLYSPNIKSLTIGNSVTSIGDYAFYYCKGLTTVTIGDSVTSIGDYAFWYCTGLTEIIWNATSVEDFSYNNYVFYNAGTAGDGITVMFGDNVQKIPACLFYVGDSLYSPNIKSLTIGSGVTSIGDSAFWYCTGLTEIIWNATSVEDFSYNSEVFYNAGTAGDGITVTFGDGVETIPAYLFYVISSLYIPNIKSLTIGNSVTSIGSGAFEECTGLKEIIWNATSVEDFSYNSNVFYNAGTAGDGITVTFGDNVQKIPAYAFYVSDSDSAYRTNIVSVTIGNGVTSIGERAFYNCSGLTYVTIGDSVTSIGDSAFSDCSSLTSVTIGDSVTSIGDSAFSGCSGLTSVTFENTSGWQVSLSSDFSSYSSILSGDLSDTSTAATYLKSNYYNYYWRRV